MYTHADTERNFYNIYICTHFNFVIYGISIEIVIFYIYRYKFRKCLQ